MLCSGVWLGGVVGINETGRRRTFDLLLVLREAKFTEPVVDIVFVPFSYVCSKLDGRRVHSG